MLDRRAPGSLPMEMIVEMDSKEKKKTRDVGVPEGDGGKEVANSDKVERIQQKRRGALACARRNLITHAVTTISA